MKKIIALLMILIIGIVSSVYISATNSYLYAGSSDFPQVSIQEYSKLQLDTNETYTALNTSDKFLSDKNITSDAVLFQTTVTPIQDTRNKSFIKNTAIPALSDIQANVVSNQLNSSIPSTDRWWLNTTQTLFSTQSANVVNSKNKLDDEEYRANYDYFTWKGSLPIENKKGS